MNSAAHAAARSSAPRAARILHEIYIVHWLENLYGDVTRIYPVLARPLGD